MNSANWISILTICITILGWKVADIFSKHRDFIMKRKNTRIEYLINAYRLLESASNRKDNELIKNLEVAIADIQLFGTYKQILLAQDISKNMSEKNQSSTLDLLKELRRDLREELNLEHVPDELRFIRINE